MMYFLPLLFTTLVLAVVATVVIVAERRLGIARGVVRQMAMITSQNVPLGTGLMLAADAESGKTRKALHRIAELIASGASVGDAMARGYPTSSGLIRSVVRAGERAGRLPAALRLLARDLEDRSRHYRRIAPASLLYGAMLLFVVFLVWTWSVVIIMPKMREIASDFGAPLPRITIFMSNAQFWGRPILTLVGAFGCLLVARLLLGFISRVRGRRARRAMDSTGDWLTRATTKDVVIAIAVACLVLLILMELLVYVVPTIEELSGTKALAILLGRPLWTFITIAFIVAAPLGLQWVLRPRRSDQPYLSSRLGDRIRWITPGLGRMEMASGLGIIASLLRLFTAAGMSLEQAAALAADTDLNDVLRARLRRFAALLEAGTPPPRAAHDAGLGEVLASALRAGQYGDRLDASLRFAADYYRSLISRFWLVVRSIAWPVVTLFMAVLIAAVVTSMFLPLVTFIDAVTNQV